MSTIADFGIPENLTGGILQPMLKDRWRVTFQGLGGGVESKPVTVQAVSMTRPNISFEEIELHRYNSRSWIAGKHNYEPITLTIEYDVKGEAGIVLQEQIQKQKWLTGAEGPFLGAAPEGSLYKFVTVLDMLDGREQVIEKWTLEGCWFQVVDYGDLDYAASEAVQTILTIRYDHPRQDIGGYNAGQGIGTGGPGVAG